MIKIAFISGPALGHVSRMYKVALAIQSSYEVEIHFLFPESSAFAFELVHKKFKAYPITVQGKGFPDAASSFALGVERHLTSKSFGLVVYDANPLVWISLINFLEVPRVMITNVFLTRLGRQNTVQVKGFKMVSERMNNLRAKKKLPQLSDAYDLYEADKVLLADPKPIVDFFGVAPDNFQQCGACAWEHGGVLPEELINSKDILLLSMGSTGKSQFDEMALSVLKDKVGSQVTVYAGNQRSEMERSHLIDYAYEWLPLSEVLSRTKMVVSQGGAGSTYRALANQCPVIVFPAHQNHKILGEIVESLGLGVCVDSEEDIERLKTLDLVKVTNSVRRFARSIASENGGANIAIAIGSLL
jgi:UDP:flavonoid glycosyltransferase YjiC (YdhE family)